MRIRVAAIGGVGPHNGRDTVLPESHMIAAYEVVEESFADIATNSSLS